MKLSDERINALWIEHNRDQDGFARAIESEAYKNGQADMGERAARASDVIDIPTVYEDAALRKYSEAIRALPIEEPSE